MRLVSRAASRGTTVLCSVHQPRPEVVRLLDKIILLSRGSVAFSGPPGEAEAYFASIGRPFLLKPLILSKALSSGEGSGDTIPGVLAADPADAMLDVIGDAEAAVDGGVGVAGEEESSLVIMSRGVLVEQVRVWRGVGYFLTFLFVCLVDRILAPCCSYPIRFTYDLFVVDGASFPNLCCCMIVYGVGVWFAVRLAVWLVVWSR